MFGIPVTWEMVSGVKVKFTPARFTWPSHKCRTNKRTNSWWCWIWEQSSHNTENMNVAESMPLQVGRPAIEPKKWAPLWRACHFYETSSVHLALRLSHCLAHILAHMMNLSLTWCFVMCITSICWYICGENKSLVCLKMRNRCFCFNAKYAKGKWRAVVSMNSGKNGGLSSEFNTITVTWLFGGLWNLGVL